MKTKRSVAVIASSALATLVAAGFSARGIAKQAGRGAPVTHAIAVLSPTEGHKAAGVIHFNKTAKGIHVHGEVTGLPDGEHGFHVHEFGNIDSPDGKAAGPHFNPTGAPHAGHEAKKRHVGDLGNIKAVGGVAKVDVEDDQMDLQGEHSIIGRGLIVHEKADDGKTQDPPGNAGARYGHGVIGIAKGR